jgi:hypothetical protein
MFTPPPPGEDRPQRDRPDRPDRYYEDDDNDLGEIPDIRRRPRRDDDSELSGGEWALCILCGGIACIVGIVYLIQGKTKGGKMIGLGLLFSFLWRALFALVGIALDQGRFR